MTLLTISLTQSPSYDGLVLSHFTNAFILPSDRVHLRSLHLIKTHTRRNTFFLTSFRVMTRVHINLMGIMHHLLDLYDERQAQGAPSFAFSPQAGIHSRVCELVRKYTLWGPKFHVGKRRRGR